MNSQDADQRKPQWPLYTIDFEASSLSPGSYPIEVGVCRWRSPNVTIEGWATLIAPTDGWEKEGSWSPASGEVHRIPFAALARGQTPHDTVLALNTILGGHTAYCDGGPHDLYWARTLLRASGVPAAFKLGDFDQLTGGLDQRGYGRMLRFLERAPPRHRARDDAERLMKALARGLDLSHGTSRDIRADEGAT